MRYWRENISSPEARRRIHDDPECLFAAQLMGIDIEEFTHDQEITDPVAIQFFTATHIIPYCAACQGLLLQPPKKDEE